MIRSNRTWLLLVSLFSSSAVAEMTLNLTKGVTAVSRDVYDLHMLVMWICIAIGAVVFGAMFWSMIFHRKSKGVKPATFHESTKVEILWTAIPIFILIAMAIPATITLIDMENNDNSDITIQITGSQWKWHYKYFDQDIEFYSLLSTPKSQYDNLVDNGTEKGINYLLEVDKPLVIPINKKVRFLITSDDVIHSWWVPAFAVKQDANPGFINEAWTIVDDIGIYRGQCAELCGKDHGFMPIVVEVKSEENYAIWINEQKELAAQATEAEQASMNATLGLDELMASGEQTYLAHCSACHQVSGTGLPPAFPALKDSIVATTGSIDNHISLVVNGKNGMPSFGKQLTLKEIAAVVTYERNAWGNNTNDIIQAADVGAISGKNTIADVKELEAIDKEPLLNEIDQVANDVVSEDLIKSYTFDELMSIGEGIYNTSCAACHQVSGEGLASVFPALKGSKIATGDVAVHIDIVVNGSATNPAMAAFKNLLTATDIAAVVTYERNAWGNMTGDVVQPAVVNAISARKEQK